jgi:hypothetical protein
MLDYGAGNVRSLVNAINRLGHDIQYVSDPSDILKADVSMNTLFDIFVVLTDGLYCLFL